VFIRGYIFGRGCAALGPFVSLEYFLESFPSVTREQAADVIRFSQQQIEQEIAA
jgi:hypothetical protein